MRLLASPAAPVALALALGLAAAHVPPAAAQEPDLAAAFAAADLNGDGVLDVDEFVAAVVMRFDELDTDDSGSLTAEETPDESPDEFVNADRDGDGVLSVGEAVGERIIRFFAADTNRDGVLSLEELEAYRAREIAG